MIKRHFILFTKTVWANSSNEDSSIITAYPYSAGGVYPKASSSVRKGFRLFFLF